MEILHKPTATVGQVVKDLDHIVAKNPNLYLDYSNDDGNDMYVNGVKLRKGVAILETTQRKKSAATVEELLSVFRMLDSSVGVVLQDGWEMLNIEPYEDGTIIKYDDEDCYCLFMLDRNVRLITTQQMETELKGKYGKEDFSRKVALVMKEPRRACLLNSLRWHYGKLCLCYSKDEEKDSITVAELLEEFPTCAEFMVCLNGKYYTVEVGEKGIFFCHNKGEERYLCFNLGEVVFDPMEEFEI
jgi:hypothetical protein